MPGPRDEQKQNLRTVGVEGDRGKLFFHVFGSSRDKMFHPAPTDRNVKEERKEGRQADGGSGATGQWRFHFVHFRH